MCGQKAQTWTRVTRCREVSHPAGAAPSPCRCSPVAHPLHTTGLATSLARRAGFLRHRGTRQESSGSRGAATHRQLQHPKPAGAAKSHRAERRKSALRLRTSRAEAACAPCPHLRATPCARVSFFWNLPARGVITWRAIFVLRSW